VRLAAGERDLLAALPTQLLSLLKDVGDELPGDLPDALRRLLPPAYTTDEEAERAYVSLTRQDLLAHHRESLETMSKTAGATHLDGEQLVLWLAALNDIRLVLGSILHVTEDDLPPPANVAGEAEWIAYHYLGGLQSEVIDVLEETLPDPLPGADDLVPDDHWGEPPGGLRWDGTPQPGPQ